MTSAVWGQINMFDLSKHVQKQFSGDATSSNDNDQAYAKALPQMQGINIHQYKEIKMTGFFGPIGINTAGCFVYLWQPEKEN